MKKIFLVGVLAITNFFVVQARHGRMIMCFDIENAESSVGSKPLSEKPVVMNVVFALYQKTAPVLMSMNLWWQICYYYKRFKQELENGNFDIRKYL